MQCDLQTFVAVALVLVLYLQVTVTVGSVDGEATDLPAADRGITATDVKAVLLAAEGNRYGAGAVQQKLFPGPVLGYVTPWNSHGYDVATRWRAKFTHISPVWYQLRADEGGGFKLTGGHDVDQGWIARLREPVDSSSSSEQCSSSSSSSSSEGAGGQTCGTDDDTATSRARPLIVPRVMFELGPEQLVKALEQPSVVVDLIVAEIKTQGLDGLVLEGWMQWSGMGLLQHEGFTRAVVALITDLAARLHAAAKVLLLAIPPVVPSHPGRPGAELAHMQVLAAVVDGFSLMTYDYTAAGPGPNFPLPWQEQNVKELTAGAAGSSEGSQVAPEKVLMGIPFYGYDFTKPGQGSSSSKGKASSQSVSANPIMGQAFLAALRKAKPKLKWEAQHAEHKIKYKDGGLRHTVYYPTPAALEARVRLAGQLGVGLSIWELGQGMDSFLDLL